MPQPGTTATYTNVQQLAIELRLDETACRRALEIAQLSPDSNDWRRYIDHFLITVGALLILAGVTAFFAWNWADLSHMSKFALIQFGVVTNVVLAWRLGIDSTGGRASLFASAFLVGVLLAVFGQVYQTGADPYSLFLGWAVLILPWAVIGRQAGLWMLLQMLLNLGFILYWTQVLDPPNGWWQLSQLLGPLVWLASLMMNTTMGSIVFAMNAVALLAWETGSARGVRWMQGRWYPRVIAFGALSTVLIPTLIMIIVASFGEKGGLSFLSPAIFGVSIAACLYFYQYRKLDLFILTLCLFGAIMVIMSLSVRYMVRDIVSLLFLAILLTGQVAGAAYWLRNIAKRWETQS